MTNRYSSPEAFKSALEQRLRNLAERDGRDLVRLRQLVVFDRFLARVFRQFGESMVLKGGLALETRLRKARTTRDVDLRVASSTDLLQLLQAAGRLDLHDFLVFEVATDQHYPAIEAEGLLYGGRPTLIELLDTVRAFLDPLLQGQSGTWDPTRWSWGS